MEAYRPRMQNWWMYILRENEECRFELEMENKLLFGCDKINLSGKIPTREDQSGLTKNQHEENYGTNTYLHEIQGIIFCTRI